MRVALVHDWLTGMRGGEKCLEVLCRLFPEAHLYTLIHRSGSLSAAIEQMDIRTSFLQRLPGIARWYRYALPLMPRAIERFRLDGYDLVVSLSHCVAKAVQPPPGVPHVCYCFTPMRYAWHMREAYFERAKHCRTTAFGRPVWQRLLSWPRERVLAWLRDWDRATADRVTHFVAISQTVRRRIAECYNRACDVIFPPVDTEYYSPAQRQRDDFYLCVSAFAPYKRIDLAIEACNRLGRRLVIVGAGPEERHLRRAAGPGVEFRGWQPDDVIRELYRTCRALLFPGIEDFGIVPVEAQACGAPVIVYGVGGATETVVPAGGSARPTGVFFPEQTVASLAGAIGEFERSRGDFHPEAARRNAERFEKRRFEREISELLRQVAGEGDAEAASRSIAA